MKVELRCMRTLAFLRGLVISCAVMGIATSSANAQGICVPDTLSVTAVSGRIVLKLNIGETPLDEAIVTLKKGNNAGPIVAKQSINKDGSFNFSKVKPGKYQLKVTAPGLRNFYLDLEVRRSKATEDQSEIIVIMGIEFLKPCSGSSAVLRVKKD